MRIKSELIGVLLLICAGLLMLNIHRSIGDNVQSERTLHNSSSQMSINETSHIDNNAGVCEAFVSRTADKAHIITLSNDVLSINISTYDGAIATIPSLAGT